MSWNKAWPTQELQFSRRGLESIRALLHEQAYGSNDQVEAELARFLVIRSCGHIEYTFAESIACYVDSKSHDYVTSYVRSGLFKGRNPTSKAMCETLGRLNSGWESSFEDFLSEDLGLYQRELNFLVDRRNKIAHGQSEGIGRRKALDLAEYAFDIGDWIIDCLDPRKTSS